MEMSKRHQLPSPSQGLAFRPVARRNHNTKKLRLESCPRSLMAANRVRERLRHFAAQPVVVAFLANFTG